MEDLKDLEKKINFFFRFNWFQFKGCWFSCHITDFSCAVFFCVFFDVCVVSQVVRCSASLVLTQSNFLLKKVLMMFNCR